MIFNSRCHDRIKVNCAPPPIHSLLGSKSAPPPTHPACDRDPVDAHLCETVNVRGTDSDIDELLIFDASIAAFQLQANVVEKRQQLGQFRKWQIGFASLDLGSAFLKS